MVLITKWSFGPHDACQNCAFSAKDQAFLQPCSLYFAIQTSGIYFHVPTSILCIIIVET